VIAPTREAVDLVGGSVVLDLLVKEQGIDTVLHLAQPRIYSTNGAMGSSLVMLKNVLDVCVGNGLFLIALSCWEIYSGYKTQELRADEFTPPRPGGVYGLAKLFGEDLIRHHHERDGLAYALLRSSPVYGPGGDRPKFIHNFLQKALQHEAIVAHRYLNGFPKLDLLHIDDLCRAIVSAFHCRPQGTINVGSGIATSTTDVAQALVDLVASKSVIGHHDISEYAGNIAMDTRRAGALLAWSPRIDLAHGLASLVQQAMTAGPRR
jgi:UDP-glucuronate decarboxylase